MKKSLTSITIINVSLAILLILLFCINDCLKDKIDANMQKQIDKREKVIKDSEKNRNFISSSDAIKYYSENDSELNTGNTCNKIENIEENDSDEPQTINLGTFQTLYGKRSYGVIKSNEPDSKFFFRYEPHYTFTKELENFMAYVFRDAKATEKYIYIIANNYAASIYNSDIVLRFSPYDETFTELFVHGEAEFTSGNQIKCTEYKWDVPEGGCNADANLTTTTKMIKM